MMQPNWRFAVLILLVVVSPMAAYAEPMPREDVIEVPAISDGLCVSNVFQSNMVLQREKPIHLWGWAAPGEEVTVEFAGKTAAAVADKNRRWQVTFPALSANSEPQKLTVQGANDSLVLENILIGDVWVLGGQSNMEFSLSKVENGPLEIVSANFPEIRMLTVPFGQGPKPKQGFARLHQWSDWSGRHFRKGDWEICSPETVGELSAIGYAFVRRIHKASKVPIGVIDASRGGTTVEAWTPLSVLREIKGDATQAKLAFFDNAVAEWNPQLDLENRIEKHQAWIAKQTKEGKPIPDDKKESPSDLKPGPIGNHNYPGNCYAGMISPIAGLSIKGAIFHQGYNNAFDGSTGVELYREVFPEMINAWRQAFNDPEMPFGILSLCTDGNPQTREDYCEKMFNAGIEIRAAQYETFLNLYNAGDENIGFVSTYDLRRRWYHPQLKLPAGERIARWALATQYDFGQQLKWRPPMVIGVETRGDAIVLKFDADVSDPEDGAIQGFAIAAEDRKFQPADVAYAEKGKDARGRVQFDRKQLVLTSPMVSEPIHFRYAWGRNPLANLQASGNLDLPVATQRSDDWKMEQVPLGVLEDDSTLPISRGDRNKIVQALREQDKSRRLYEAKQVIELLGEK